MSSLRGPIPGDSTSERARALAGMLATAGVQRLSLVSDGVATPLHARVTDLPGIIGARIASEGVAVLEADHLGARFTLTTSEGVWECPVPLFR